MPENQINLKFKRHEPGTCQKCGGSYDELYTAVVNSGELSHSYVMCKKCCIGLKKYVDNKNLNTSESLQQNNRVSSLGDDGYGENGVYTQVNNISNSKLKLDYSIVITSVIFFIVSIFLLFNKSVISSFSYIAIGIGLLLNKNTVSVVGGAVLTLNHIIESISFFASNGSTIFSTSRLFYNFFLYGRTGIGSSILIVSTQVLSIVFCVMLALTLYFSFGTLGIVAGIVKIISLILSFIISNQYNFNLDVSDVILVILTVIGCFMLNKVLRDDYEYYDGSDSGDGIYF